MCAARRRGASPVTTSVGGALIESGNQQAVQDVIDRADRAALCGQGNRDATGVCFETVGMLDPEKYLTEERRN
jgi:hypothetical protein